MRLKDGQRDCCRQAYKINQRITDRDICMRTKEYIVKTTQGDPTPGGKGSPEQEEKKQQSRMSTPMSWTDRQSLSTLTRASRH